MHYRIFTLPSPLWQAHSLSPHFLNTDKPEKAYIYRTTSRTKVLPSYHSLLTLKGATCH